jgi:heme O synthase-like polyprenyltransferase
LGLVILSLAPAPLARYGLVCRIGVLLLSSALLYFGAQLGLRRSTVAARRLLRASIVYLPLVFVLWVADRLLGTS